MCGIAGILDSRRRIDEGVLTSMTDALTHRGPDDSGIYIDNENGVGLGHRRLSILDLSPLGHQPMANDDESIWITYNGEVYNFSEIRTELIGKGYTFKSNSDTEVIIKAYEEWGVECVHKFIGMFAFGIWDRRKKKLLLLRDRAGVKPLYYYRKDGLFLFGSELKALMEHPDFEKEINYEILPSYIRYGYVPTPHSIFKNTYKLRPGHYLSIESPNRIEEKKYWDAVDYYLMEPFHLSEDEILEELESLLVDSFKYRLVSDVPVGVFLSGGIDSSLLTALLQKNVDVRLKTFSIGFYESTFNEAEWAKKIANYLGTDHTEFYVSAREAFDTVGLLPNIYDEPFADNSGIPTYLVSRLTRQEATVALSADAGDELFCGYRRYWHTSSVHDKFLRIPAPLRGPLLRALTVLSPEAVDTAYRSLSFALPKTENFKDKHGKILQMLERINRDDLPGMYKEAAGLWTSRDLKKALGRNHEDDGVTLYEDTFGRLSHRDLRTRMMVTDFKTYMVDDILTKLDRATMSVSLEGRDPFLDHRIVEYAARIPMDMIYRNGQSKHILRRILYKHVPRELIERPKMGFNAPLHHWFEKDLSALLNTYLGEERLKKDGTFDSRAVSSMVRDFTDGKSVNINTLWSILMYEMWKEKWMTN